MDRTSLDSPPAYTVATPVYEGPLDLLLQLIERAELDITELALAQVTDQFLSYLDTLQARAAEEVSAFLVVASRLMQIKSEALLPRPPQRDPGEEDPGEALVQQLLLYKRFKEVAKSLAQREERGLRTYLRLVRPPKVEGKLDLSGVDIDDLAAAARRAFALADRKTPLGEVVSRPKVSIREKIRLITTTLRKHSRTTFEALLGSSYTQMDVVVTFLAVLELVKRFRIQASQESLFGDIELHPAEEWDDSTDFELEFSD